MCESVPPDRLVEGGTGLFLTILLAAILLSCGGRMTARLAARIVELRASGRRAHAWALLVAVTLLAAGCGPRQGEFLTTIKQVRDLKPSDAGRGYPVRLRGITTYSHAPSRTLIVQVGADAILVATPPAQAATGGRAGSRNRRRNRFGRILGHRARDEHRKICRPRSFRRLRRFRRRICLPPAMPIGEWKSRASFGLSSSTTHSV